MKKKIRGKKTKWPRSITQGIGNNDKKKTSIVRYNLRNERKKKKWEEKVSDTRYQYKMYNLEFIATSKKEGNKLSKSNRW